MRESDLAKWERGALTLIQWLATKMICFNAHSMYTMNVTLGAPYEALIKRIIEKGYAGNQTEVIRQALLAYERMLEDEELALVHRAVETEMKEIDSGKTKTYSFESIKKALE